jgi:hypothetical protein
MKKVILEYAQISDPLVLMFLKGCFIVCFDKHGKVTLKDLEKSLGFLKKKSND